jgi:hypothetical protein
MMDDSDMATRLALLEKTMVTRDFVADREDKLLARFEGLLTKHESRLDESMKHAFKVYGHEISDQLRILRNKITEERDEKLATALKDVHPAPVMPPRPANEILMRWGLPIGLAAIIGGPGTVTQVVQLMSAIF